MLQAYAKAKRKELSQIITIYQSVLDFSFEELWMEITIKHNKEDVDNMLDDINAKLIEVCDEYLKENKIGLDKYQLSMIVMDLYTKTITALPQPFYVQARESKNLMKEYVKANKEYIEKAKKVKKENKELEKEADELAKRNKELQQMPKESVDKDDTNDSIVVKTISVKDKEIPISMPKTKSKPKKWGKINVDDLADTFTF